MDADYSYRHNRELYDTTLADLGVDARRHALKAHVAQAFHLTVDRVFVVEEADPAMIPHSYRFLVRLQDAAWQDLMPLNANVTASWRRDLVFYNSPGASRQEDDERYLALYRKINSVPLPERYGWGIVSDADSGLSWPSMGACFLRLQGGTR